MNYYIIFFIISIVSCNPDYENWYPTSPFLHTTFRNYSTINNFVDMMEILPDSYRNVRNSVEKVTKIMRFGTSRPMQKDFIDDLGVKLVNHYVYRNAQIRTLSERIQRFFREVYRLSTDRSYLLLDKSGKITYLQEFTRKKGNEMSLNDKVKFDEMEMNANMNLYQTGLRRDVDQLKH
ncbi:unnamed protein product [Auanema sp. JU1783]|nr:unnamed protein product [Auanema sp. JU1783]